MIEKLNLNSDKGILMKKLFAMLVCGFSVFASSGVAFAEERGSANEAVAMVKKAVTYLKANGKEKAFAEFNSPGGKFHDRDLYIVVYDINGVKLAHGVNQKMMGKNNLELRDAEGKYMIKDFIEVANKAGKGWVDYKWPNPTSKMIEQKSTYVEKIDDLIIGCGVYK